MPRKRGRQKQPRQSTLPPRHYYRGRTELLSHPLSDKAFRLWHIIAAYAWDGSGCDLSDAELANLLRTSRQWVIKLRGELRAAGFLREHFPSGGRRLLEPTYPTAEGPAAISVNSGLHHRCKPQLTPNQEEEVVYLDPTPLPLPPQGGGVEGADLLLTPVDTKSPAEELVSTPVYTKSGNSPPNADLLSTPVDPNSTGSPPAEELVSTPVYTKSGNSPPNADLLSTPVDTNKAAIAQALRQRGVFPDPATRIAILMDEAGLNPTQAVELFLAHYQDTGGSLALTVWRLKQGLLELPDRLARRLKREAHTVKDVSLVTPPEPDGPPLPSHRDEADDELSRLWQRAQAELQHQMTRATFDTWLCHSRLISADNGACVIAVHSEYARQWLEQRLKPIVARTLAGVLGRQVEVQFVVNDQNPPAPG
ncbi:MAG: hypothetical protein H5T62_09510 [Anaerolineae bacterium]|nr:hypothetical protein [Anaerolineae bacterium]